MNAAQFIVAALDRLSSEGFRQLSAHERFVAIISEAKVCCDMDGLDAFLKKYPADVGACACAFEEVGAVEIATALKRLAREMPTPSERGLDEVNDLISRRHGYTCEAIEAAVAKRILSTDSE